MDLTVQQLMNGYTYSNNNPVSLTDPTGLRLADCAGGWEECGPGPSTHRGEYVPDPVRTSPAADNSGALSSTGRDTPRTPSSNAPFASKKKWYTFLDPSWAGILNVYDYLTDAACMRGLELTCGLWSHYRKASGDDFEFDLDPLLSDSGLRSGKGADKRSHGFEEKLEGWAREAKGRCVSASSCAFSVDSKWIGTQFTSGDGAVGIGHAQMRITGNFYVSNERGAKRLSATYQVEVYKDWNFDKTKTASIPGARTNINLAPFAEMHEYGYGREYAMVGKSSIQHYVG
jgi:hypothetical protein